MIDLRKNKQYGIPSFEEWKAARDEESRKNFVPELCFVIGTILLCLFVSWFASCESSTQAPCDQLEYQIRLEMDSAYIYDGDRFVGALAYDSTQAFDQLMMKDNE